MGDFQKLCKVGVNNMRKFLFALLLLLMGILAGCGEEQNTDSGGTAAFTKAAYSSKTSKGDCYLCGGSIEDLIPSYCGQNNIALISLNTFEIRPIEINRYDKTDGRLIEEYIGAVSCFVESNDNGFSASLMQDSDRGYATGCVYFHSDEVLDTNKAADYLCEDCLNEILPSQIDRCFGVGAINLATREIRIFEEHLSAFTLGDFYFACDLQGQGEETHWMDFLTFYCPIRYEKEP